MGIVEYYPSGPALYVGRSFAIEEACDVSNVQDLIALSRVR